MENWRLLCREQRGIALATSCLVLIIVVVGFAVCISLNGAGTIVSDLTSAMCRQAVWTEARREVPPSITLGGTKAFYTNTTQ